jgi:tetratricopeptide (TPR) repeat protein
MLPVGVDHVQTMKTVHWLGNVYKKQNKLSEAEIFYIRALKSSERLNGMNHIETVRLVNSTAILLKRQGRLKDAEAMYQRALEGYEDIGGADSRDALATRNNLGILCKATNDTTRAREYYDAALHGRQKLLGKMLFCLLLLFPLFSIISFSHVIVGRSDAAVDAPYTAITSSALFL